MAFGKNFLHFCLLLYLCFLVLCDASLSHLPSVNISMTPSSPVSELAAVNVTFICQIAAGKPKQLQNVSWFLNDKPLNETHNCRTKPSSCKTDSNKLFLLNVNRSHHGNYSCKGKNKDGWGKFSDKVQLIVHYPPGPATLVQKPYWVEEKGNVSLICGVKDFGRPPSTAYNWRNGNDVISNYTSGKFFIDNVTINSNLNFTCNAENEVGVGAPATIVMDVLVPPAFKISPRDQTVGLNAIVSFACSVSGNPPPSLTWTKEGSNYKMPPNDSFGLMHVLSDGTLRIQGVQEEDAGVFICSAKPTKGFTITANATLQVIYAKDNAPQIIEIGPTNQTLSEQSVACLPCEVRGNPMPQISWYKNDDLLSASSRINISTNGALVIRDLQASDSGWYMCAVTSEYGVSFWQANLQVKNNSEVEGSGSPDHSTIPSPPGTPKISTVAATSVKIAWTPSPKHHGSVPFVGYRLEYFSPDLQTGWLVAAYRVKTESFTVNDLKPETVYKFVVRAENSRGLSIPSNISEGAKTLRLNTSDEELALDEGKRILNMTKLTLKELKPVSNSSVRVVWEVMPDNGTAFFEGVYIRFRDVFGSSPNYNLATVMNTGRNGSIISNLRPFAKFDIFLVPFFKSSTGRPSNLMSFQTSEDVPSAPPEIIQVLIINVMTVKIQWVPPPSQQHNGILVGYKIEVQRASDGEIRNLNAPNESTTLHINNWATCELYRVRVAACTRKGPGPYSAPIPLVVYPHQPPTFYDCDPTNAIWWFILLAAILCLVILGGCVFCCINRKNISGYHLGSLSGLSALSSRYEAAKNRKRPRRITIRPLEEQNRL